MHIMKRLLASQQCNFNKNFFVPPLCRTLFLRDTVVSGEMRVAIVHPDLGLGGAERLVIDAALALQSCSQSPTIYTAFRDSSRCFADVKPGREKVPVQVLSVPFPRAIFGRFQAVMAALRCAYIALWVCLRGTCDVAFVDIVSLPVVIFALFSVPVVFYCHFPDKLLEESLRQQPKSLLRRLYRRCVDAVEYFSLRRATRILCNSVFTKKVFEETYPLLAAPDVVYPCITTFKSEEDNETSQETSQEVALRDNSCWRRTTFVSINRFEKKKNLQLAVQAFYIMLRKHASTGKRCQLIIAGGFDARIEEHVEQFAQLEQLIGRYDLQQYVTLKKNITDAERRELMLEALAVVYTPSNEHFGIVPLEAMQLGVAVLATNSGGPKETIVNNKTGLLREATTEDFADGMLQLAENPNEAVAMGQAGKRRVASLFSERAFAAALEDIFRQLDADNKVCS